MHFAILFLFLLVFFLLFWGLTYTFHKSSIQIVSWLIWVLSLVILGLSVFWMIMDTLFLHQTRVFAQSLEGMSNSMGSFAFLWGLAAVFILFSKWLFRRLHSKHVDDRNVVRRILLLAKNHHDLFGWVTLAAATSHGIYFLFHKPKHLSEFYSGVGAWAALAFLVFSGILMKYTGKRTNRTKILRISHIALTAGYSGAIVLHFRGSLFLSLFLFTAAFIAMGIIWGLMQLNHSL